MNASKAAVRGKTKVCARCKIEKPLEEFHKHAGEAAGVQSYCRECTSIMRKEHRARKIAEDPDYRKHCAEQARKWRRKHREEYNAAKRERYQTDDEYRASRAQVLRAYYERNRAQVKARVKATRMANPEPQREYHRQKRARLREERPKVYFIQAGTDGPIKIGFTKNSPYLRLRELKTSMYDEPRLLGIILAPRSLEADLHERFRHLHIRREWFSSAPDLLDYIAENAAEYAVR